MMTGEGQSQEHNHYPGYQHCKAKVAFGMLSKIWKTMFSAQRSNVETVLLYGCSTSKVTNTVTTKLQTFINRCIRNMAKDLLAEPNGPTTRDNGPGANRRQNMEEKVAVDSSHPTARRQFHCNVRHAMESTYPYRQTSE